MSQFTFKYICSNYFDEEVQNYLKFIYDDVCEQTDNFFINFNQSVSNEFSCINKEVDIEFYNELLGMCIEKEHDNKLDKNINGYIVFFLLGLSIIDTQQSGISTDCQKKIISLFTSFNDAFSFYDKYVKIIPVVYKELHAIQDEFITNMINDGNIISINQDELFKSIDNIDIHH